MRSLLIGLTVLIVAVGFSTITTNAQTQLVIVPPTSGEITFSNGSSSVAMCTATCALTGTDRGIVFSGGPPVLGSYTLDFGPAVLSPSGTNLTVTSGGLETLTFTDTSGGSVTLSLQLTLVTGGETRFPDLKGTYVVTSVSGDLTSSFSGVNSTGAWTIGVYTAGGCLINTMHCSVRPTTGLVGDGFTRGGASLASTPEPSSMLLFGTGLVAFGVALRRRLV